MSENSVTRVELHGALEEEYTYLHKAMESEGFTRTIISGDGKEYHLTTATYYRRGRTAETPEEVRQQAINAVKSFWEKKFEVISTFGNSYWNGLEKV